jgi:hypothetical protein
MSLPKKKPVRRKNMKVRCAILLAVAFFLCGVSFAQDSPKVEITADYSYFRLNPGLPSVWNSQNLNGGGGQVFHEIPPPYDFLEDDCADESSSGRAGFALRGPVASDSGQARSKAYIYPSIVFAQMSESRTHSLNGGTK